MLRMQQSFSTCAMLREIDLRHLFDVCERGLVQEISVSSTDWLQVKV